ADLRRRRLDLLPENTRPGGGWMTRRSLRWKSKKRRRALRHAAAASSPGGQPAVASSRARRTRTLDNSVRYSALPFVSDGGLVPSAACPAASASDAASPLAPASADSSPEA